MSINTDSNKLAIRIKSHKNYSTNDINEWILNNVLPRTGEKVLDIGCGTGEQLIRFAKTCGTGSTIIGIDASYDSLSYVKETCSKHGFLNVKTILGDIDNLLVLLGPQNNFDIVISCFALYYSKNISKLISDVKKILTRQGRFFVCGPVNGNNAELIDFQSQFVEHTNKPVQYPMTEIILPEFLKFFQDVSQFHFHNSIIFPDPTSLIEYWKSYFLFDKNIEQDFINHTKKYFETHTKFITTKKVIGILAKM